jgi:hypothetical protein
MSIAEAKSIKELSKSDAFTWTFNIENIEKIIIIKKIIALVFN